jgi:transposase
MYLRRIIRKKQDVDYGYWALVESIRTERGPRQRVVATIGKLPDFNKEEHIGWEEIGRILNGDPPNEADLFEKQTDCPEWATVNTRGIGIERLRRFGDVYLGLALWKRLKFDEIFNNLEPKGREDIPWKDMFCLSTLARFCQPSSKLAIAEGWYEKTALEDLLGIPVEKVNDDRLYRTLDMLLPHKDKISKHLQGRYTEWFGSDFDFLFYDITSTYFEGQCPRNPQAKRGYSRDNRPDCKQVCIGLVVNRDGLPIGYEVFDGNRRDVTTLEEMVDLMEKKYGRAKRTWVLDRGFVSEENLEFLRTRGATYIVGSLRSLLKDFKKEIESNDWATIQSGVEVKLARHPEFGEEKFILCRSQGRKQKERAMLERQVKRLEDELKKIAAGITKGRLKNASQIERRIGRWFGRNPKAEVLFDVELMRDTEGHLKDLKIERKKDCQDWAEKINGCYILRTNLTEEDPATLWKTYMNLVQAEKAFRMEKSDLGMRPVFHQTEKRVQAHIFVCFLALAMYKCLELWMIKAGLGASPAKLLEEFREIRSMDAVLPVKNRAPVRLRLVAKPDDHIQVLLHKLGLKIPNQPKMVENVVKTLAPNLS